MLRHLNNQEMLAITSTWSTHPDARATFVSIPDIAPLHVTNFLYLTRIGFYDNTPFHRVITRFMAQGGDPTGTGGGSPGYGFGGEFSDKAKHDRPGLDRKSVV